MTPATLVPSTNSPARVGLPRLCAGFAVVHAAQAALTVVITDLPYRGGLIALDAAVAAVLALVGFMTSTRRLPGWRQDAAAATVLIIGAAAASVRIDLLNQTWPAAEFVLAIACTAMISARSWFWSVIGASSALVVGCVVTDAIRGDLDSNAVMSWVDILLLMAVGTGAGLAMRRARTGAAIALVDANRQLLEQSVRDPLTGVANRRGLELVARPMIDLARRQGEAVHCLVLDIDTLRGINDEHGVREGDGMLLAMAEALRVATRGTDVVARLGGDEFAMIGPGTGTTPLEMERRVRAHLATVPALPKASWQGRVSAGSATLVPWDADDLDGLLERAEQDLALRRTLKRRAAARMRNEEAPEVELPAGAQPDVGGARSE